MAVGSRQKYPEGQGDSDVEPDGQNEPEEQFWIEIGVLQNAPTGHTVSEMDPGGQ
jgi:hypothetical protein